jgi:hypothetical protein
MIAGLSAARIASHGSGASCAEFGGADHGYREKVRDAGLPSPLRHFLAELDELRSADLPDSRLCLTNAITAQISNQAEQ